MLSAIAGSSVMKKISTRSACTSKPNGKIRGTVTPAGSTARSSITAGLHAIEASGWSGLDG
ncbi:hypothetical protein VA596_11820 [Amycolatopsis sp., V23-08]|uniref:Uncharacterized protein n=1 Tax=Amycolatopsis heterodermiae TaxID=3110235 RepID=A0ABU5R202_9PSEU|nr:hypothetical protein [Amycolatopsis sp., V23-08]MEA5360225.1 hypothetical protein [Amycolatopsis sp., V23-08]